MSKSQCTFRQYEIRAEAATTKDIEMINQDMLRLLVHYDITPAKLEEIKTILITHDQREGPIHYCHGMADICYLLMAPLTGDRENTFWTVAIIVNSLLPSYHVQSMLGFHIDCHVLNHLLQDRDLTLYQHFQGIVVCLSSFHIKIHVAYIHSCTDLGVTMQLFSTIVSAFML